MRRREREPEDMEMIERARMEEIRETIEMGETIETMMRLLLSTPIVEAYAVARIRDLPDGKLFRIGAAYHLQAGILL